MSSEAGARLVVDAMNVIGSRPTGWWRDRDGAVLRLAERLSRLARASGREVTLVVDGRPIDGLPEGQSGDIEVLYAQREGRNAADDRIVAYVARLAPGEAEVVTSDRELARRAGELGAGVRSAGSLLAELDALEPPEEA